MFGGLQGPFCYIAFAPAQNVAVFIAIDKFDLGAAFTMGEFANELLATMAPRRAAQPRALSPKIAAR